LDAEKALYKAASSGASRQQLENIHLLQEELETLKIIDKQMKDKTERLKEQAEAAKQLRSQWRSLQGPSGVAAAGTAGAMSVINSIARTMMPNPANLDVEKKSLDELIEIKRGIRAIEGKLEPPKAAKF